MPTVKRVAADIRGTETHRLVNLETELVNIYYLLSLPGTTAAQKERLRSLLLRVEAELKGNHTQFHNAA